MLDVFVDGIRYVPKVEIKTCADGRSLVMRASAGGEKCDQIGRTFSDRTPSHKEDR